MNLKKNPYPTKMCCGMDKFEPTAVGNQTVDVTFPMKFDRKPIIVVSWCDTVRTNEYMKDLLVIKDGVTTTGFQASANRINADSNWWFTWIAVEPDTAWT